MHSCGDSFFRTSGCFIIELGLARAAFRILQGLLKSKPHQNRGYELVDELKPQLIYLAKMVLKYNQFFESSIFRQQ